MCARIYIQIPYYNTHITPIFDELAKCQSTQLKVGLLQPGSHFRPGYDQDKFIDDDLYLKLWETDIDTANIIETSDIVAVHGFFSFWSNYLLLIRAMRKGKKIWIFSEALKPRRYIIELYRRLFIFSLNMESVTFFELGYKAGDTYSLRGATKWKFVSFGYAVSAIENENLSSGHILKLIYVGQLIERKRVDVLLRAVARIRYDFKLEIYGAGEQSEQLISLAGALGLEKSVTFNGLVSKYEIERALLESDCLILPSEYDGWGAVVNEGLEAGLAVVVSSKVGARKLVDNECIFDVNSSSGLFQILNRFVQDRLYLDSIKRRNRSRAKFYRPSEMARKLLDYI